MGLHAVKILGIHITKNSKNKILEYLEKYLNQTSNIKHQKSKKGGESLVIVTPNPEQIVLAQQDKNFAQLLNQADVAIPDGGGVVWAAKIKNQTSKIKSEMEILDRIPGVELMEDLVALAAKERIPIGLIGGYRNVAVEAFECLHDRYPGLSGIAMDAPDFQIRPSGLALMSKESGMMNYGKKFESNTHNVLFTIEYSNEEDYFGRVGRIIRENNIHIVFVALGAPKQEYFIARLARNDRRIIFMSVGGSFDIITGRTPRAPQWAVNVKVPLFSGLIGSEFIWRLIHEPRRFGRQLALLRFVFLALRERYLSI